MAGHFQDWNPVVIRGKSVPVSNPQQKQIVPKPCNQVSKKLDDVDGPPKIEMVSQRFKQDFINARTAKNKSQDQLAKEARNLKGGVKVIKDLEAGKLTMKEAVQVAMACRNVIGIIKK